MVSSEGQSDNVRQAADFDDIAAVHAQRGQRRPTYSQDTKNIGFEKRLSPFDGHVLDRVAHGRNRRS
jgi:hypothetical protein